MLFLQLRLKIQSYTVPRNIQVNQILWHTVQAIAARFTATCFTARAARSEFVCGWSDPAPSDLRRRRSRSRARVWQDIDLTKQGTWKVYSIRSGRENRAGIHCWRRYKSACLNLLAHAFFVLQSLTRLSYPHSNRHLLQRAGQMRDRINQWKRNHSPSRWNQFCLQTMTPRQLIASWQKLLRSHRHQKTHQRHWTTQVGFGAPAPSGNPLLRNPRSSSRVPRPPNYHPPRRVEVELVYRGDMTKDKFNQHVFFNEAEAATTPTMISRFGSGA